MDPRAYQSAVLLALLAYGTLGLDFGIRPGQALAILVTAQLTQYLFSRLNRLPYRPASALVSSLSLILLLRTDLLWAAVLAAGVTIAGKFLIRAGDKHLFNPTNLGLTVMLLTGLGWVSPGQWGNAVWFAFLLACLGSVVVTRAARADVTLAFLAAYLGILFGRALWLGDPLAIPVHQMQNGAFLLFAFYMISDPRTTPDSRAGRVLFAVLVAAGAGAVQFGLYRPYGLIWSLAACSLLTPLIDRLLPGPRYRWPQPAKRRGNLMKRKRLAAALGAVAALGVFLWAAGEVLAFCGFFVAKADASLFNKASRVVLVRDEDRTVLTMANDFKGDPKEFAIVIPVPTFIERGQIHVAENALIDHLDAYTAPRLVEYFDEDPCRRILYKEDRAMPQTLERESAGAARARALGVTIEASYTVGEYDILILSAEQSGGLETWLKEEGYRIPKGASRVLGSYIKQDMRFFVAKVNLEEQSKLGFTYLRPLQVAYETPKFMLPIRLGTLNADGPQELFVYTLTRQGRVETTNYRTVKLPTGMDIPVFVKDEFGDFYRDMFGQQVKKEDMRAVFLEYAWDMNWCDPCAADPLSQEELRELGVFWVGGGSGKPMPGRRFAPPRPGGPQNVFVTRLHVRYDAHRFPEDLVFHQTSDRENFQGRYVLRHPWKPQGGDEVCEAGEQYLTALPERLEKEAQTLASLTGWDINAIRDKIGDFTPPKFKKWWERLWGD